MYIYVGMGDVKQRERRSPGIYDDYDDYYYSEFTIMYVCIYICNYIGFLSWVW
jgi:hypothetical protein